MGLYNMIFGVNEKANVLLAVLGLTQNDVPRFRDCYITEGKILVYTRTGGGNRPYYESEESCRDNYPEYFDGEEDPCGPWNCGLRANPHYLSDHDDSFDSTYAEFYFRFPPEYEEDLKALAENSPDHKPSEKWQMMLAALDKMKGATK